MTPGKRYPIAKDLALNALRNRKTQLPAVTEHKAGATELYPSGGRSEFTQQ